MAGRDIMYAASRRREREAEEEAKSPAAVTHQKHMRELRKFDDERDAAMKRIHARHQNERTAHSGRTGGSRDPGLERKQKAEIDDLIRKNRADRQAIVDRHEAEMKRLKSKD